MGKRGGYKRTKPLYALKFEDEEFDGLEVMAKSLPLREFFELQKLQQKAQEDDPGAQVEIILRLTDVIVSWNLLDDDDKPVPVAYAVCRVSGKPGEPSEPCSAHQGEGAEPCEYAGLCEYDLPFVLTVFYAWMEAVSNIPNLSKKDSNGGGTSQELSIQMDVLSPSPGS